MAVFEVRVTYRSQHVPVRLSEDFSTLQQLSEALEKEFDVDYEAQKLLVGGRIIFPTKTPHKTLLEVGETQFHHVGHHVRGYAGDSDTQHAHVQALGLAPESCC